MSFRADPTSVNGPIKVGTIHEILKSCPTKAIVIFDNNGLTQRAALRSKNFVYDGSLLGEDIPLEKFLSLGSKIYMRIYPLTEFMNDMCKYFVIAGWKCEDIDFPKDPRVEVFHGLCTEPCYFSHHGENFGVAFCKENKNELIEFNKSDVYILGERFKEDLKLKNNVEMQCDAIPSAIDPVEGTRWKAQIIWRGKRPAAKEIKTFKLNENDMVDNIKQLIHNSRSIFLRTTGQIIKLLSREYGVALAMIRTNEWHSVLFHASSCCLNDVPLHNAVNLQAVFQPGDKMNILAAKAPSVLKYQWVASHISPLIKKSY